LYLATPLRCGHCGGNIVHDTSEGTGCLQCSRSFSGENQPKAAQDTRADGRPRQRRRREANGPRPRWVIIGEEGRYLSGFIDGPGYVPTWSSNLNNALRYHTDTDALDWVSIMKYSGSYLIKELTLPPPLPKRRREW
jgi:hypothetical protein